MATLDGHSASLGSGGEPQDAPRVIRVGPERRPEAIARLLGVRAPGEATARFESQARAEGNDLGLMWATIRAERVSQTVMAVRGPGRAAMLFVSPDAPGGMLPTRRAVELVLADRVAALRAACAELPGVRLAQGLVEPQEEDLGRAYSEAGFTRLATLDYLRRDLPRRGGLGSGGPTVVWPEGVRVRSLADLGQPAGDAALAQALEGSYEQTLDCPGLCGLRAVEDVIESHRAVGVYDPALWWLVEIDDRPSGCMLVSRCPLQGTVELVYLGLSPRARGRGLGRGLLEMAVARLAERGGQERTFACAVDQGNTPALRLYSGAKFRVFASRVAFVRALS